MALFTNRLNRTGFSVRFLVRGPRWLRETMGCGNENGVMFAVVCLVAWPLNQSEAGVNFFMTHTSLHLLC